MTTANKNHSIPNSTSNDQPRHSGQKITIFREDYHPPAKLADIDAARTLAILADKLGGGFVAIGELVTSTDRLKANNLMIKKMIEGWIWSRAWGKAAILSDEYELPCPNKLPNWKDLPADVCHFFKLIFALNQPNAFFFTCRLDPDIGDKALAAKRGPSDWLADRITRALSKLGITTENLAFSLEYAPKASKTLHKLHIHGTLSIPTHLVEDATKALKKALAPAYKTHGTNQAIKIERANSANDVARYIPKEAYATETRLVKAREEILGTQEIGARGKRHCSPHRSSTIVTAGARRMYQSLNDLLYGNPFLYAGLPDFS